MGAYPGLQHCGERCTAACVLLTYSVLFIYLPLWLYYFQVHLQDGAHLTTVDMGACLGLWHCGELCPAACLLLIGPIQKLLLIYYLIPTNLHLSPLIPTKNTKHIVFVCFAGFAFVLHISRLFCRFRVCFNSLSRLT